MDGCNRRRPLPKPSLWPSWDDLEKRLVKIALPGRIVEYQFATTTTGTAVSDDRSVATDNTSKNNNPMEHFRHGSSRVTGYDPAVVEAFLDRSRPENALVIISDSSVRPEDDREEGPWRVEAVEHLLRIYQK